MPPPLRRMSQSSVLGHQQRKTCNYRRVAGCHSLQRISRHLLWRRSIFPSRKCHGISTTNQTATWLRYLVLYRLSMGANPGTSWVYVITPIYRRVGRWTFHPCTTRYIAPLPWEQESAHHWCAAIAQNKNHRSCPLVNTQNSNRLQVTIFSFDFPHFLQQIDGQFDYSL